MPDAIRPLIPSETLPRHNLPPWYPRDTHCQRATTMSPLHPGGIGIIYPLRSQVAGKAHSMLRIWRVKRLTKILPRCRITILGFP